jgi:ribonucleoside-diphosphate reductase alpha chain
MDNTSPEINFEVSNAYGQEEKLTLESVKNWIPGVDYPKWMVHRSLETLKGGYLIGNETPKDAINRIAYRVAELIPEKAYEGNLKERVFEVLWNQEVSPSSPVWSNFGTPRGLPISCFGSYISDSISGIYDGLSENAKMSQLGGGTSSYWGDVRARGSNIANQSGTTGGPFEFLSNYDGMISKVSQGGTRRGSHAAYIDFDHPDVEEILEIKRVGCSIQNLFTGISISKEDREAIYDGDKRALRVWAKVLESRNNTGMPYLLFKDNVNDGSTTPPWYGLNKTQIKASNLCSEIMLPSSSDESFVCCLLSMNAITYDVWKNTDAVNVANIILEAILEDFIIKTTGINEMQRSRRFALRHRSVGLGVLGIHSYLQSKRQPFVGIFSTAINKRILQTMKTKSRDSSKALAKVLGNAPIVSEYNQKFNTNHSARHSTLLAIAPTVSNSTISGGVSPGIEPISSNYFSQKSAKGNFTVINKYLIDLIDQSYPLYNTKQTLDSIRDNSGSVQHLDWMSLEDREVFKTFSEINQFELVRLASVRQVFIDQGQSLNVHVAPDTDPKLISALYLMGAELGIKSFYYQRSTNILRNKNGVLLDSMDASVCNACEG